MNGFQAFSKPLTHIPLKIILKHKKRDGLWHNSANTTEKATNLYQTSTLKTRNPLQTQKQTKTPSSSYLKTSFRLIWVPGQKVRRLGLKIFNSSRGSACCQLREARSMRKGEIDERSHITDQIGSSVTDLSVCVPPQALKNVNPQ